ncbi:MAG: phosphotransferase [Aggregatilineales bacterium]
MAQKPNISAQDTIQFLQERFNEEVSQLTLLSGGEWSQAYSFVQNNKKYVLRWCNSSETFEKDVIASSFSCEAMPIPKVTEKGMKFDKHFAISEFAQGEFIDTLTSVELKNTLPALLRLFDALRNANLANTTGYGGWNKDGIGSHKSWKEYLLSVKNDHEDSLTHGWYANLANSRVSTTIFDQFYSQFGSLVEKCPEGRELIHSDLLNYNLLVSDSKISAVIDWQCSLYGDSLYDVAWFIFYAPWYPQFAMVQLCQKVMAHFESVAANNSNLRARLLCYQLHIGLGSIAYNSFKKDWKAAQEIAEYTLKISRQGHNL